MAAYYVHSHVRRDERFINLNNLCELSVKLVDTEKHEQYHVVYKLLNMNNNVSTGRKLIPYPSSYRVKPVGYSGFGYPLPS